jgi:hypothetical protein
VIHCDWTPTHADPARRLVQVRQALNHLYLSREHRDGMEELAKYTQPTRAQKGK